MYIPPFAPRKYGLGYLGITYLLIGELGKFIAGASTSSSASLTRIPNARGFVILPLCLHPTQPSGLYPSIVSQLYGPSMRLAFSSVAS